MIETYAEQVDNLCKELDAVLLVNSAGIVASAENGSKNTAGEKVNKLDRLLKVVKVEVRSSAELKSKYREWILKHEQRLEGYRRTILLNASEMREYESSAINRFIGVSERMNNSTKQLLDSRRAMQDVETVGLQIQNDLARQREMLQRNQERAQGINTNLGLADKLVTSLSKWWR